ncbi:hypothetical protein L1987_08312 [Smallanthus sonchifolius]|uniref:Uncharacterized protein n=1 Tax=Smallanthus sonchifolius TaxID=185202 RepID=A0ACB9JJW7_9ASTR|nr:hypothetical protein L1987_08312 [Smallanthus sonchifolius]
MAIRETIGRNLQLAIAEQQQPMLLPSAKLQVVNSTQAVPIVRLHQYLPAVEVGLSFLLINPASLDEVIRASRC